MESQRSLFSSPDLRCTTSCLSRSQQHALIITAILNLWGAAHWCHGPRTSAWWVATKIGNLDFFLCEPLTKLIIIIINPGLNARRSPMSHLFLTRWVSKLLGLALVSWAFARIGVPSLSILGVFFHSLLSAIGFQSCFFVTADVSPPIRSTLHLLTF